MTHVCNRIVSVTLGIHYRWQFLYKWARCSLRIGNMLCCWCLRSPTAPCQPYRCCLTISMATAQEKTYTHWMCNHMLLESYNAVWYKKPYLKYTQPLLLCTTNVIKNLRGKFLIGFSSFKLQINLYQK